MWKAVCVLRWFVCRKGWVGIGAALLGGMVLQTRPQARPGYTGAPREGTCRTCHEPRRGSPTVHLSIVPSGESLQTYIPGGPPLRLRLRVSYEGAAYYGFSLTILDDTGGAWPSYTLQAGEEAIVQEGPFGRRYLGHWGWSESGVWEFVWRPPAQPAGPLHGYVGVVAANGDQTTTGDWIAMWHQRIDPTFSREDPPFFLRDGLLWVREAEARMQVYDLGGRWLASYRGEGPHCLPAVGVALLVLERGEGERTVHRVFLP